MRSDYAHEDSKTSTDESISYKITMPLINNEELQRIDIHYNELVDEFIKQFVKEKDMIITQRLMMNLRKENKELKKQLKIKHNAFMSSVEENCELAKENQELKKNLEKKYEKVGALTTELLYEENSKIINEITFLKIENQKYKEIIDKSLEYIETHKRKDEFLELNEWQTRDLLDILKKVELNE